MQLIVKNFQGEQIGQVLEELSHLRITIFREFPYLYDGDKDYEKKYLETYLKSPLAQATLVFDGSGVVGASTCIPLVDEVDEVKSPFLEKGFDVESLFYFGESLLLPQYRGSGVGKKFFYEREAHALKSMPEMRYTAFCAVERPLTHPGRPKDYEDLSGFWQKMGYEKRPALQTQFTWKDTSEEKESPKTLTFWLKRWESDH